MKNHIMASLIEAKTALESLLKNKRTVDAIKKAAQLIIDSFRSNGRLFSCGNGGSMCDAMHLAEELSGRYRKDRRPLPAMAISDPGHMSCVANDLGYEYVFSRYLEAHANHNDCLVAISTSGKSLNVLMAAEYAQKIGMRVISLTGQENSPLAEKATIDICTPGGKYADRVQELHIKVIHLFIELVEREFFPDNY